MPQRLPSVLTGSDLPEAELRAALLDGEVYRVGSSFTPIDEVESARHRARALLGGLSERVIAEQRSAAWIWGALDAAPDPHQVCVTVGARVGHARPPWLEIREVVIDPAELAAVDGLLLTTPLRTAVDLARFSAGFGEGEERMLVRLLELGRITVGDCLDELDRRRNLPNKRQAVRRLRLLGAS
jgi:hypothetical protein